MFDLVGSLVNGPNKRQRLFIQGCQALGLQASNRPGLEKIQFHGRSRQEVGVSMGYYWGRDIQRYSPWGTDESVHIFISVARQLLNGWWLELSAVPPRGHGAVPEAESWQVLVTADILAHLKAIPRLKRARLLTLTNEMREGKLAFVLPHTWNLSVLHLVVAPDLSFAELERCLNKAFRLQEALLRVDYYDEFRR